MNLLPVYRKTRIAPTPSGYLHLGNLLSFTITAGLAKRHQASILLRIDDLDQERLRKEYVEDIFDTLDFMGISWDEGPRNYDEYINAWSQVHRMNLYEESLQYLRSTQHVFACNCSRSSIYAGDCLDKGLSFDVSATNWRMKTDNCKLPPSMHHFVVRKKDGNAAYQLSSLIDDSYFGVDLVVRGQDLWDSTLAQVYLGSLLPGNTFPQTAFYHHTLITGPDGLKLSKSAGSTSIRHLRTQGMSSAAIYTLLGKTLGCNGTPGTWSELFYTIAEQHYFQR